MNKSLASIQAYLSQLPVISSHEHHLEQNDQSALTLDGILRHSYVGWCSLPPADTKQARAQWLSRIRTNTYFIWLEKAICALYGFEEINEGNWDQVSRCIAERHKEKLYHWTILTGHAHYRHFIQDSYWNPGDALSNPALVRSAYRMDSWMMGFHPDCRDHDGNNPRQFVAHPITSLDAYEAALRADLEAKRPAVAALKCAVAYERSLSFAHTSRRKIEHIFGASPQSVSGQDRDAFGNYIFHLFLKYAREWDLPVQIHTGLARLAGSNPLRLEPVIAKNPDIRFVLFHGGYPWCGELAALAHNYANVYIDMNWLPLVSTSAAISALHTFLDILPDAGHIAWGGDSWTSEESFGAAMAFEYVVSHVLAEKYENTFYNRRLTERMAERLLFQNAQELYGI